MQDKIKSLPWTLVVILGLGALIRPAIKILGSFADFPVAPIVAIAITVLIAVVWIAAVVVKKPRNPILTLAAAGGVYAISSILLAVIIQTIAPGSGGEEVSIPVLLTAGLIATTLYNIAWGALLGVIAKGIIDRRTA